MAGARELSWASEGFGAGIFALTLMPGRAATCDTCAVLILDKVRALDRIVARSQPEQVPDDFCVFATALGLAFDPYAELVTSPLAPLHGGGEGDLTHAADSRPLVAAA